MKVLFLAAEATPLVKVGGLADVAGELPPTLRSLDIDIRVTLPFHAAIERQGLEAERLLEIEVSGQPVVFYEATVDGEHFTLVDGPPIREATAVYGDPYEDAAKFVFFSIAALQAIQASGWRPDVVHANDWHTVPAVIWLAERRGGDPFWDGVATLLTVHNLPYMGAGAEAALAEYGFRPSDDARLPPWARSLPLPIGLSVADWLSTVSPTYAEEIQTPEFGCGLEGLLKSRRDQLVGILNGIDPGRWDPAHDGALAATFSVEDLGPREENKRRLQAELGLPQVGRVPLIGMVTRLDHQKGVDLALQALEGLVEARWQFVILGSGDPALADKARAFAAAHPERAHSVQRFDSPLARLIYGGADMILIPSRYEPCGLVQMIAMRYGSVPVVRATGGLKDTVIDHSRGKTADGFAFDHAQPEPLAEALRRAFEVYGDPPRWEELQLRGMSRDFSWRGPATEYLELYRKARRGSGRA